MLFTLTSLTNFPSAQLNTAVCLCSLPPRRSLKHGNAGKKRGQWADGAVMAVRNWAQGEFQAELLQAEAVQLSALNTMTPPRAIGRVCVHMQQYVQPSQTARLLPPAPPLSSLSWGEEGMRGGRLVPRLPSWRSRLTGAL